ncbi:MAG TPA: aminoacetone oxidase family FAD-binding enzyme, partial [Ruminococcaceae bacterium]|nr:aminoacetone oxidase family FAD-binding enzyme [Oscillospiraceae bacterium]
MKQADIILIGGGASGLCAAIEAKRTKPEASVLLLEHLPKVGKKILATGNGRCNLGNLNAHTHDYTNKAFVNGVFSQASTRNLCDFFRSLGLYTRADSEGRLYPLSNTAASVLDALRFECTHLGVEILCDTHVEKVKKSNGGFVLNDCFFARRLIVCCGGCAAPSQGSDGSGYALLRSLGHTVTPTKPSLVQLTTDTAKIRALKGVRATAKLTLSTGGETAGEVLFTDYGLSGIAAMDLSRYVLPNRKAAVTLDFLPDFSRQELTEMLGTLCRRNSALPGENMLTGLVPKALGSAVLKDCLGAVPQTVGTIQPNEFCKIAHALKAFSLTLTGTKGYRDAQVTAG